MGHILLQVTGVGFFFFSNHRGNYVAFSTRVHARLLCFIVFLFFVCLGFFLKFHLHE